MLKIILIILGILVLLIILAVLAIFIFISRKLGGNNKMKNNGKSPKEEMLQYMQDRYNEEFEFIYIGSEAWSSPFIEMIVHSKKFPKKRITVHKSGSIMSDNYTDFLMKEKIEKEIGKITNDIYPESKVIYDGGGMPFKAGRVEPSMNIAEYSKNRYLNLSITICIFDSNYKENKDENLEELRFKLEEKKYKCSLLIFYIKEDKLDSITSSNWTDKVIGPNKIEYTFLRGSFSMDDDFKFGYTEWREIK